MSRSQDYHDTGHAAGSAIVIRLWVARASDHEIRPYADALLRAQLAAKALFVRLVFRLSRFLPPCAASGGNSVWITPRVQRVQHDGASGIFYPAGRTTAVNVVGKIVIRDNVFIGSGATILAGVEIGPSAVVAAGSVVTRDVPPGTVAGGGPTRPICTLEEYFGEVRRRGGYAAGGAGSGDQGEAVVVP